VHRGVLFEALVGAAQQARNLEIHTGTEIVTLARAEPRLGTRSRYCWVIDKEHVRHGPHELVVVADGARSQLRDDTSTQKRVTPYPWGALWFLGQDTRPMSDPGVHVLQQVVDGNRRFVGMLPTGLLPVTRESSLIPSPRLISLFWSIRGDRVEAWRQRGVRAWKDEVLELAKEAAPVLDQIQDEGQLLYASYHDVIMHPWHTRNVVYVGDAAHATSPQMGQGCNLALWDAMELADCIGEEEHHVAAALERYSRRREDHLAFYQFATRWLTPFFQGDVESLGAVRDVFMPAVAKVPFVRRVMTLSMLGVMDGFLGRTLPLG
jgi:2-polyprenyl-6-methoxyphenol hydroxylase-like FAD-dependent oxidoreductase